MTRTVVALGRGLLLILTRGPYPLSRGAIPHGQRAALKAEYDRITRLPVAGQVLRRSG